MLKTNFVSGNILQVIFSKSLEIHTCTHEFYNWWSSKYSTQTNYHNRKKTLEDAHKNPHNIHVKHKKTHHKGKTKYTLSYPLNTPAMQVRNSSIEVECS